MLNFQGGKLGSLEGKLPPAPPLDETHGAATLSDYTDPILFFLERLQNRFNILQPIIFTTGITCFTMLVFNLGSLKAFRNILFFQDAPFQKVLVGITCMKLYSESIQEHVCQWPAYYSFMHAHGTCMHEQCQTMLYCSSSVLQQLQIKRCLQKAIAICTCW